MSSGIHFNVNLKKVYMTMTPVCMGVRTDVVTFQHMTRVLFSVRAYEIWGKNALKMHQKFRVRWDLHIQ